MFDGMFSTWPFMQYYYSEKIHYWVRKFLSLLYCLRLDSDSLLHFCIIYRDSNMSFDYLDGIGGTEVYIPLNVEKFHYLNFYLKSFF